MRIQSLAGASVLPEAPTFSGAPQTSTAANALPGLTQAALSSPTWHAWLNAAKALETSSPQARPTAEMKANEAFMALRADPIYTRYELTLMKQQAQLAHAASLQRSGQAGSDPIQRVRVLEAAIEEAQTRLALIDAGARFDAISNAQTLAQERLSVKARIAQAQADYNGADLAREQAFAQHQEALNTNVAAGASFGGGLDILSFSSKARKSQPPALSDLEDQAKERQDKLAQAKAALVEFDAKLPTGYLAAQQNLHQAQARWQKAQADLALLEIRLAPDAQAATRANEHAALAEVARAETQIALAARGDPLDAELEGRLFVEDPLRRGQEWALQVAAAFGLEARQVSQSELRALITQSQRLRPELKDNPNELTRVVDALMARFDEENKTHPLSRYKLGVGSYSYGILPGEHGAGRGNGLTYWLEDEHGEVVALIDGLVAPEQNQADRYASVKAFQDHNTLPSFNSALAIFDPAIASIENGQIALTIQTEGAQNEGTMERFARKHPTWVMGLTIGGAVLGVATAPLMGVVGRTGASALLAIQGGMITGMTAYSLTNTAAQAQQERARGRPLSGQTAMMGAMAFSSLAGLVAIGAAYGTMRGGPHAQTAGKIAQWANQASWIGFAPVLMDIDKLATRNHGEGFAAGEEKALWANVLLGVLPPLAGKAAHTAVMRHRTGPTPPPLLTVPASPVLTIRSGPLGLPRTIPDLRAQGVFNPIPEGTRWADLGIQRFLPSSSPVTRVATVMETNRQAEQREEALREDAQQHERSAQHRARNRRQQALRAFEERRAQRTPDDPETVASVTDLAAWRQQRRPTWHGPDPSEPGAALALPLARVSGEPYMARYEQLPPARQIRSRHGISAAHAHTIRNSVDSGPTGPPIAPSSQTGEAIATRPADGSAPNAPLSPTPTRISAELASPETVELLDAFSRYTFRKIRQGRMPAWQAINAFTHRGKGTLVFFWTDDIARPSGSLTVGERYGRVWPLGPGSTKVVSAPSAQAVPEIHAIQGLEDIKSVVLAALMEGEHFEMHTLAPPRTTPKALERIHLANRRKTILILAREDCEAFTPNTEQPDFLLFKPKADARPLALLEVTVENLPSPIMEIGTPSYQRNTPISDLFAHLDTDSWGCYAPYGTTGADVRALIREVDRALDSNVLWSDRGGNDPVNRLASPPAVPRTPPSIGDAMTRSGEYAHALRQHDAAGWRRFYEAVLRNLALVDRSPLHRADRTQLDNLRWEMESRLRLVDAAEAASALLGPEGLVHKPFTSVPKSGLAYEQAIQSERDWLRLMAAWPEAMDAMIAQLGREAEHGQYPPRFLVTKVLEYVEPMVAAQHADGTPGFSELSMLGHTASARGLVPGWQQLERTLLSVLRSLRDHLRTDHLTRSRSDRQPGLRALLNGPQQYRDWVRYYTASEIPPRLWHDEAMTATREAAAALQEQAGWTDLATELPQWYARLPAWRNPLDVPTWLAHIREKSGTVGLADRFLRAPGMVSQHGWPAYGTKFAVRPAKRGHAIDPLPPDTDLELLPAYARLRHALHAALDTGIHEMGWSLDQARRFRRLHLGADGEEELDLSNVLSAPGRGLVNLATHRMLDRLRSQAQAHRGDNFSDAWFEQEILKPGRLALNVLERHFMDSLRPSGAAASTARLTESGPVTLSNSQDVIDQLPVLPDDAQQAIHEVWKRGQYILGEAFNPQDLLGFLQERWHQRDLYARGLGELWLKSRLFDIDPAEPVLPVPTQGIVGAGGLRIVYATPSGVAKVDVWQILNLMQRNRLLGRAELDSVPQGFEEKSRRVFAAEQTHAADFYAHFEGHVLPESSQLMPVTFPPRIIERLARQMSWDDVTHVHQVPPIGNLKNRGYRFLTKVYFQDKYVIPEGGHTWDVFVNYLELRNPSPEDYAAASIALIDNATLDGPLAFDQDLFQNTNTAEIVELINLTRQRPDAAEVVTDMTNTVTTYANTRRKGVDVAGLGNLMVTDFDLLTGQVGQLQWWAIDALYPMPHRLLDILGDMLDNIALERFPSYSHTGPLFNALNFVRGNNWLRAARGLRGGIVVPRKNDLPVDWTKVLSHIQQWFLHRPCCEAEMQVWPRADLDVENWLTLLRLQTTLNGPAEHP